MNAPKIQVVFGEGGIRIEQWIELVGVVTRVLHDLNLADRAADCTLTSYGRTIVLCDPDGNAVWRQEIQ